MTGVATVACPVCGKEQAGDTTDDTVYCDGDRVSHHERTKVLHPCGACGTTIPTDQVCPNCASDPTKPSFFFEWGDSA
jgi:RNA polymerase subunit RPABC4/transcription elongation factor Spt4